ncbi:MAG: hypothetical protein LBD38_04065, partial [Streptococcaceae bacterium]|nr:hypothetical protein [Streptococcaceae bacterium]
MTEKLNYLAQIFGQIQMSEEEQSNPAIENLELISVEIDNNHKRWNFFFKNDTVLPIDWVKSFDQRLQNGFRGIISVDYSFTEALYSEDQFFDYWLWIKERICERSPILRTTINGFTPVKKGKSYEISLSSEPATLLFNQDYAALFTSEFNRFGFPNLTIKGVFDSEEAERAAIDFEQKTLEREFRETGEQASKRDEFLRAQTEKNLEIAKEIEKKEKREAEAVEKIQGSDAPILLGKAIGKMEALTPMKDVDSPTDVVVFEGYVFDAEIRQTRAGKKILD